MTFESWIYNDSRVTFSFYSVPLKVQDPNTWRVNNIEWEIFDAQAKVVPYVAATGIFNRLIFNLIIQRQGGTMLVAIMIPGALISFLGHLYYFLPRGDGSRLSYLTTVLLTEIMFLVMITTFVPLSKVTPEIGWLFLAYTIILSLLTVVALFIDKANAVVEENISLQERALKEQQKEKEY
jgi:hypothetical protein